MNTAPLNILHVEDNTDHAWLVARALDAKNQAASIRLVEDGQQALDYLFRQGEHEDQQEYPRPHLVLLDLRLPKVDGMEVLRTMKTSESLRDIPVVILTSSETEKDIREAYALHANSYLVKPSGFALFSEMMATLGTYWLHWNRYPWSANGGCQPDSRGF